jgi:hypothetical protein
MDTGKGKIALDITLTTRDCQGHNAFIQQILDLILDQR